MTDLTVNILFAGFFAVVTVWQSWAWTVLLACLPLGMLLRRRLSRGRALVVGAGSTLVVFAANTGLIGATLQGDPDFAADIYPSYFLGLVLALCWLLHTLLATAIIWGGCRLTEAVLRATAPPLAPSKRERRSRRRRT